MPSFARDARREPRPRPRSPPIFIRPSNPILSPNSDDIITIEWCGETICGLYIYDNIPRDVAPALFLSAPHPEIETINLLLVEVRSIDHRIVQYRLPFVFSTDLERVRFQRVVSGRRLEAESYQQLYDRLCEDEENNDVVDTDLPVYSVVVSVSEASASASASEGRS